jgi:lipopolysaccharide transport system ATP-binding protein
MAAIRSLCTRGLVLDRGRVAFHGDVEHAIYHYFQSLSAPHVRETGRPVDIVNVRINGEPSASIAPGDGLRIECDVLLRDRVPSFRLLCVMQNANSEPVVVLPRTHRDLSEFNELGVHHVSVEFPPMWLRPGVYSMHFRLQSNDLNSGKSTYVSDTHMLDVSGDVASEMLNGYLTPDAVWRTEAVTEDTGKAQRTAN